MIGVCFLDAIGGDGDLTPKLFRLFSNGRLVVAADGYRQDARANSFLAERAKKTTYPTHGGH